MQRSPIKIRNPKLEIRNKPRNSKLKIEIRNGPVWCLVFFGHLNLFRISDFEFRAFSRLSLLACLAAYLGVWVLRKFFIRATAGGTSSGGWRHSGMSSEFGASAAISLPMIRG